MHADLTYREALAGKETTLTAGSFLKAAVFLSSVRGERFVVKDFGQKGFWERNLIGRLIIRRESRAYRALAGIDGIPAWFKQLSPFSLAVEYLEGKDLGAIGRGEIGPGVLRQFEQILEDLHERGWVHLDLQRRTNILIVNGRLYVIDLASAMHPGWVPVLGRLLTRLLSFFDRLSLVKLKRLYAPESLTQKERKWLKLRNLFMPTKW